MISSLISSTNDDDACFGIILAGVPDRRRFMEQKDIAVIGDVENGAVVVMEDVPLDVLEKVSGWEEDKEEEEEEEE